MIHVARFARENNVPLLGICLGLQVSVIEFMRNVCGEKKANSTEFVVDCKTPVVAIMDEQRHIIEK
jgi:CTP synthase